ncbi:capsular associated protein [Mycena rebaudengoi]|nr:capsular associated protein [Mycena rebaudengoi]
MTTDVYLSSSFSSQVPKIWSQSISTEESAKMESTGKPSPSYPNITKRLKAARHDVEGGMHNRHRLTSPRSSYVFSFKTLLRRNAAYLFLAVVTISFLRAGFIASAPPPSDNINTTGNTWRAMIPGLSAKEDVHPISRLMAEAETRYRNKLAAQSATLPAAVAEYRRRYGRAPPKGFDAWYNYARNVNFVMVDEFDGLNEDLVEAYWGMEGREMRRRVREVGRVQGVDVVRVEGGEMRVVDKRELQEDDEDDDEWLDSEASARARGFMAMLHRVVDRLPDMDFAINAKAEGRVVVAWEALHSNSSVAGNSSSTQPLPRHPDWRGAGSVWEAWRRTCAPASPARRLFSSVRAGWGVGGARDYLAGSSSAPASGGGDAPQAEDEAEDDADTAHAKRALSPADPVSRSSSTRRTQNEEFAFVGTGNVRRAEEDFCKEPARRYMQGHFFSDWRTLPALYPVLSPARAAGFGDVRIPSHYYYGSTKRYTYGWDPINIELHAVDKMEVPWERKKDVVFWRGASTGGGSNPSGFGAGYQRHRFLRMSSVGLTSSSSPPDKRTTPVTFPIPPPPSASSSSTADAAIGHATAQGTDNANQNGDGSGASKSNGAYMQVDVPLAELNRDVMDAAFVKAVVPVDRRVHRFGDSVELGVAWGYKYLLDLDGMGYSGRFMAFLASDSVPVKSTVYDEYFSDWIEPWVHYIPLSTTYAEIYNIIAFFSGPSPATLRAANLSVPSAPSPTSVSSTSTAHDGEKRSPGEKREQHVMAAIVPESLKSPAQIEGDRRLRRISRAGKQWKQTIGRTMDMEVYVYRLALEYARLWADDREAMSYEG